MRPAPALSGDRDAYPGMRGPRTDAEDPTRVGFLDSCMESAGQRRPDRNGFITALAVRALRRQDIAMPDAKLDAMLDALERCRSPGAGYGFWAPCARPEWAPQLPDDADDTAIMTLELHAAGRLSREEARRIACLSIGRHRIARLPLLRPPWLRTGVFATWHRRGIALDLIDCTAIANALAAFAALDLHDIPGVRISTAMLRDAVAWAGNDETRACSLSPFYPEPAEFVLALQHAVEAGADDLIPVHAAAAQTPWGRDAETRATRDDHRVCSSPYGFTVWRSPALARIRAGEARFPDPT